MTTLLLAVLLLALSAATARVAESSSPSPGESIANALRTSPVYVDGAYADAVPKARQRGLAAQIRKTGLHIKVVLIPLAKGDAFDGGSDDLAAVVHDRLGLRDLILITTDSTFSDSLNGYEWPSDTHQTRDAVAAAGFLDETRDAGLADLTTKAVELVAEGKGTQRYEEATRDLGGDGSASAPAPTSPSSSGSRLTTLVAAATLALLALGALLLVRNRRTRTRVRTHSPSPFAHPLHGRAVRPGARWAAGTACEWRCAAGAPPLYGPAALRRSSRTPWRTGVRCRTSRWHVSGACGPPPGTARFCATATA
jgi:hypothetical protein